MASKRTHSGIARVLAGFIVGYVAAWLQMRDSRQQGERRTRIALNTLNKLVQQYAKAGVWDDETDG